MERKGGERAQGALGGVQIDTRFVENGVEYGSKSEAHVGRWLAARFPEHVFAKTRPEWLRNPVTGRSLELDFYCEKLQLAVEYNGEQHYRRVAAFHGEGDEGRRRFRGQQIRDDIKLRTCRERGVRLIVVPFSVARHDIGGFLDQQLRALAPEPVDIQNPLARHRGPEPGLAQVAVR
jgi:hypothetical protein